MTPLAIDHCLRRLADGFRPDPLLTVSEWADRYRVLDSRSAHPGPWRTNRAPYLREPMDALSRHSPVETVVLMWASQLGKSEVVNNWLGYIMHLSPRPAMLVQPTIDTAEQYSKQRVQPMCDLCPELAERVPSPKRRTGDATILVKSFPGGFLRISGANSAASLASVPVGDLALDEVDRYDPDVDGEGDPVDLAVQRTATFRNRKVLLTSTPTIRGRSRIEKAYEESDQREYLVACPHCQAPQVLRWRTKRADGSWEFRLQWPEGEPTRAAYVCAESGCVIEERHKPAMLRGGVWRARHPDRRVRGYHLSALYSPWLRWHELAEKWVACKDDPVRLQAFINLQCGETYEDTASEVIQTGTLFDRREDYDRPPAGVHVVTAGADVQVDRIELTVYGWGAGFEAWHLDHAVLMGDPSAPDVWARLEAQLRRTFQSADGRTLPIRAAGIDTGGHYAQGASDFCRRAEARHLHWWALKGATNPAALIWPRRPTRNKWKANLYLVGVSQAKDELMARLKRTTPGPGYMHFPRVHPSGGEVDEAFFRQLTAERKVYKRRKSGGRSVVVWEPIAAGIRNEVLDCTVYAYAALHGLLRLGLLLPEPSTPSPTDAPPPEPPGSAPPARSAAPPPPPTPPTPPPRRQRVPGWLGGLPPRPRRRGA